MSAAALEKELASLGLEAYTTTFINAGFSTWDQLSKITEGELAVLNVRLGERRRLQREFARDQQWPDNKALPSVAQMQQFVQDNASYSQAIPSVEAMSMTEPAASPVQTTGINHDHFGYEYSLVGERHSVV